MKLVPILFVLVMLCLVNLARAVEPGPHWRAPDRARKVSQLIPGRQIPPLTRQNLFVEFNARQVKKWTDAHPDYDPDAAYRTYVKADPADAELVKDFPVHIAPFGRVRKGNPGKAAAEGVLIKYCPFCQSKSFSLAYDKQNDYHATTGCCGTELYGRPEDYPKDYPLAATETVSFLHLDEQHVKVPCTVYRDRDGVVWELFIKTIFDQRRWLDVGCQRVVDYGNRYEQTADPLYVHKMALLLDHAADTYYGLPLVDRNRVAKGKDGKPLTRAEWEAVPRPNYFKVSYLGGWNRRRPIFNTGWLNMGKEHIWVEPLAQVRHHPQFKAYSKAVYGDPEALDRKIKKKLLRELGMMFKSVFSQKLLTNYQEANYVDLWLLGVLLEDEVLIDFARPAAELTLYNHTYQDGLNGEGAPNYMRMPGGYFYPYLRHPNGYLRFYPDFLDDHPFYVAASSEMFKLRTVRGKEIEFGDQHQHAYLRDFITEPDKVAENEKKGSRNWAGYGIGILRVGGAGRRQEMTLNYTRATLHNARDALSLGGWFDGVPVMRRGGYAAHWVSAPLQYERPEYQALKKMDYPTELMECEHGFNGWSWCYAHSFLSQNAVTVDDVPTGRGWGPDRGYGEVITFKGGEPADEPGAAFQVLDVLDHYSWKQVKKDDVTVFRRGLLGVTGPGGRPYVIDILTLTGGRCHTLYNSAFAQRTAERVPGGKGTEPTLARAIFGEKLPDDSGDKKAFTKVRNVRLHGRMDGPWSVTWRSDIAAYHTRDVEGKPFKRPLEGTTGLARVRLIGLTGGTGSTELISATGPWIGWMRQPLPGGHMVNGNVAFADARDFMVERRRAAEGEDALHSTFVHVIEGFRDDEQSAIRSAERLKVQDLGGGPRDIVAVRLEMAAGHVDTVVYQSKPGRLKLPGGIETDARYALVRTDAEGHPIEMHAVRGTVVSTGEAKLKLPGDYTGMIVDVIGDLTGTRQQSALVIIPDAPWPTDGTLHDGQLLVKIESPLRADCNEGYRVEKVARHGDAVRVDLQDAAPFAVSWHQVTRLPADKPNRLKTNRPMVDHGNNPWYRGLTAWFPERRKSYTIKDTAPVGGGTGGDWLEVVGKVNLREDGIREGDWYLIHGIRPGLSVNVPCSGVWKAP